MNVTVMDPSKLTGDQYRLVFHSETYSLGSDGVWNDITATGKNKRLLKVQDLTGSSLSSTATWSEEIKGYIDVHTAVHLDSPNYDYCDGVKLTFPSGVIIDKAYEPISNKNGSTIPYYIDNATNSIFFGNTSALSPDTTERTGNGVFAGGEEIVVTVHPATLPMLINYTMYDDNFGATYVDPGHGFPTGKLVDISGVVTLSGAIANRVVVQKQWDVEDVTKGSVALSDQTVVAGQDIYAPNYYFETNGMRGPGGSSGSMFADVGPTGDQVFDGIKVDVDGTYKTPTTIGKIVYLKEGSGSGYKITDFTVFGFADGTAASSMPLYGLSGGVPPTVIADLQQGY